MTVPGREQFLILETISTPRAPCYEAAHWTAERSKTPRRLFVPCSARNAPAGEHIRGSPSAHAAAAAGHKGKAQRTTKSAAGLIPHRTAELISAIVLPFYLLAATLAACTRYSRSGTSSLASSTVERPKNTGANS